jgi:hypothetical protein
MVPITHKHVDDVAELVDLSGDWKNTRLLVDGVRAGPGALHRLLSVLACMRDRELSGLEELHCRGLPERHRGRVPCRLIERALPWHLADHYADPHLLPRLVGALARKQMTGLCPAFEFDEVQRSALNALVAQDTKLRDIERVIRLSLSSPESPPSRNGAGPRATNGRT